MTENRPPPASSFSWHLYLLSATFFFIFMGAGAQQAYLVPYLRGVAGWSRLSCSCVIASVYLSMVVFRIVNLRLFHRWSDRRFTIVGSTTYLGFTLVMWHIGRVPSYPLALTAACIWGMGAAMMGAMQQAMQQQPQAPAAGGGASVEERLEKLASLKEKGLITDEEFATRKAEILKEI